MEGVFEVGGLGVSDGWRGGRGNYSLEDQGVRLRWVGSPLVGENWRKWEGMVVVEV